MTRRSAQLVVAITVMASAGCGVPTQSSPTRLDDNNVHIVGPAPSTTIPRGTPTLRAALCFVSGDRLVTIVHELPAPLSVHRALEALVDLARTGLPVGVRSAITESDFSAAEDAMAATGVALVDLKTDFVQASSADQVLALAQVVCTLTSLPGVGQVRFTLDGKSIDIPRADGSLTNEPVSRFDYSALLPTS